MEDFEKLELRSDEVQEILGTPPRRIVRWGTTVIALTFAGLIWVAFSVKYPDIVAAPIVLTTNMPPVEVVSRAEGLLAKLLVKDNQNVKEREVLMVLQSTGRFEDIEKLDSFVSVLQNFDMNTVRTIRPPRTLELGEISGDFSTFLQLFDDFQFSNTEKSAADLNKIAAIQRQISAVQRTGTLENDMKSKMQKKLDQARAYFKNQQKLYSENIISLNQLENEQARLLEIEREVQNYSTGSNTRGIDIANLQKQIDDIAIGTKEIGVTKFIALRESLSKLRNGLDNWKQKYIITAPIDGKVSLNTEYNAARQFVKAGDEVMTISPNGESDIIGRLALPVVGSGKVDTGQRVLIRLDNFPYREFGQIEGIIESKSSVPKNGQIPVVVRLPNKMMSSYGKNLDFEQKMQGEAQIITADRRFIERIFDGMKSVFFND
jgi:multidrug resistance efflux pump